MLTNHFLIDFLLFVSISIIYLCQVVFLFVSLLVYVSIVCLFFCLFVCLFVCLCQFLLLCSISLLVFFRFFPVLCLCPSVYISIVCLSQVPVSLTLCLLGCAAVINGSFFSSLHFPNTLPLKGGISAKPRIYFIDLPENV